MSAVNCHHAMLRSQSRRLGVKSSTHPSYATTCVLFCQNASYSSTRGPSKVASGFMKRQPAQSPTARRAKESRAASAAVSSSPSFEQIKKAEAQYYSGIDDERNPKVNAALSTLPPPYEAPVRDPSTSLFKHLYTTGKTILSFYKTGLKAVISNFSLNRRRQNLRVVLDLRSTYADQMLHDRAWRDIKKIPVFGLVMLICGEFTPLVVLYLPSLTPGTCQMPRQVESQLRKRDARAARSWAALKAQAHEKKLLLPEPEERNVNTVVGFHESLHLLQVFYLCDRLDVWAWPHVVLPTLGLRSAVSRAGNGVFARIMTAALYNRFSNKAADLSSRDKLLDRSGVVGDMDEREVRLALADRGFNHLGMDELECRLLLLEWVKSIIANVLPHQLLMRESDEWPKLREERMEEAKRLEAEKASWR